MKKVPQELVVQGTRGMVGIRIGGDLSCGLVSSACGTGWFLFLSFVESAHPSGIIPVC